MSTGNRRYVSRQHVLVLPALATLGLLMGIGLGANTSVSVAHVSPLEDGASIANDGKISASATIAVQITRTANSAKRT